MVPPAAFKHFTKDQLKNGVGKVEIATVIVPNNIISQQDRDKVIYLQAYITDLQNAGIIAK